MFQWMKDFSASAKTNLSKFNNRTFKEAAMATCALIAASDGEIEKEEKTKVASLIQKNELLQVFDAVELRDLFIEYTKKAADDFERLDLLNLVRKLKSNADQAETAVKIALIIANADGEFEDCEKKVVREICATLGLDSSNYVS